jgi:hypothetical protein
MLLGSRGATWRPCRKLALGRREECFHSGSLAIEGAGKVRAHLGTNAV